MSFWLALKAVTTSVSAWICWGWAPVPRPMNQRTILPLLGPRPESGTGGGVMISGVGDAAAVVGAAAEGAGVAAVPHAAKTVATIARNATGGWSIRLVRLRCISTPPVDDKWTGTRPP